MFVERKRLNMVLVTRESERQNRFHIVCSARTMCNQSRVNNIKTDIIISIYFVYSNISLIITIIISIKKYKLFYDDN